MPADGCAPCQVIDLEKAKALRARPLLTAGAELRDGRIVITCASRAVIDLTPASARTWAQSILQLAEQAELERR